MEGRLVGFKVGVGAELGWLVGGSVIGSWVWMTMAEVDISSSADIVAVTSTLTLATDKLKSGASAVKITARVLLVREALAALPNSDDTTSRMVVAEVDQVEYPPMDNPLVGVTPVQAVDVQDNFGDDLIVACQAEVVEMKVFQAHI